MGREYGLRCCDDVEERPAYTIMKCGTDLRKRPRFPIKQAYAQLTFQSVEVAADYSMAGAQCFSRAANAVKAADGFKGAKGGVGRRGYHMYLFLKWQVSLPHFMVP